MDTTKQPGPEDPSPPPNNEFVRLLGAHRQGEACTESAEALRTCVESVLRTGKAAFVKIVGKIQPAGRGSANAVVCSFDVSTKLPKEEKHEAIYFAGEDMALHRTDPNQTELPLRTVPAPAASVTEPKVLSL